MKKSLLLAGAALIAGSVSAQILSEDFESGSMPAGWGITTNATDNGWNIGTSATLGSQYFDFVGNSSRFIGTNDDDCNCDKSDDFLYTTAVDLTGQTGAVYMKFNQYYFAGNYQGAQEIGTIEVSTDGGATYSVFKTMDGLAGWTMVTEDISAYAGQNIMVGFRYNDGGGWTFGMGIDDLSIYAPDDEDVTLTSLDLPTYSKLSNGAIDIKGSYANNGAVAITSMDVEYTVNGGSPVTGSLTGLNIAPLTNGDFTHPTAWTPAADGIYAIEVKITAVNGVADADITDNVLSQDVDVYSNSYPRTVLYETFTSSTCGPCVAGNANFENVIGGIPTTEVASIKYQMSWPGDGDPYNTVDGNDRRVYYQINSVPAMQVDGGWNGNSGSFTQAVHDAAMEVPAFVKIDAYYYVNVNAKTVATCATIESMKDLGAAEFQVVIKENLTTQNVGTNGETEFKSVVKKMAPDAAGQSVTLTAGGTETICTDYTFNGEFRLPTSSADLIDDATEHSVEEFEDLSVVVWLQSPSKVVYNATNAVSAPSSVNDAVSNENAISLYPNPASTFVSVALNSENSNVASVKVLDVVGKSVLEMPSIALNSGSNKIDLNTESLINGVYFVQVTIDGAVSTSQLVIRK